MKGQALIMLVLIIALLMTVIAATSFRLTTEIQSSKSQEESVRALAAADAGIEAGLRLANTAGLASQQVSFNDANIDAVGVDMARSKITITDTSDSEFISPLIRQDEQLTFYLQEYPDYNTGNLTGNLTILFGTGGAGMTCGSGAGGRTIPAVELTYLYGASNNQVRRDLAEPCPSGFTIGGTGKMVVTSISPPETINGKTYYYKTTIPNATLAAMADHKILTLRTLFADTQFVMRTNTSFPRQGKLIRSEAYSISGPSKVVTIFQSMPQLPADFFVTTF